MSQNSFGDVPIEVNTHILSEEEEIIHGVLCIHEYWCWEGIYGQSIIYKEEGIDIQTRDNIESYVKQAY
ncbi:hypothetical protein AB2B38_009615 [Balneola sp. MJW-20]|uniref:hypothetical protein n=1 Tax=Gracilimonas aurantiaca TaxID=3234185 RepID=UPI003467438A